jgi:hypothetical protein
VTLRSTLVPLVGGMHFVIILLSSAAYEYTALHHIKTVRVVSRLTIICLTKRRKYYDDSLAGEANMY